MWLWGGDQALGCKGLCVCLRGKENASKPRRHSKTTSSCSIRDESPQHCVISSNLGGNSYHTHQCSLYSTPNLANRSEQYEMPLAHQVPGQHERAHKCIKPGVHSSSATVCSSGTLSKSLSPGGTHSRSVKWVVFI